MWSNADHVHRRQITDFQIFAYFCEIPWRVDLLIFYVNRFTSDNGVADVPSIFEFHAIADAPILDSEAMVGT